MPFGGAPLAFRISCTPQDQVEAMDKAAFLKRTPLFSGLTDKEIASVLGTAKERTFAEGDGIIAEGHEGGRGFYLLLSGSAAASKGDVHLKDFGPGDYFGEMALLLDDTPRTADVVATSATTCLAITQWDLKALIKNHPDIGIKMMNELARRLRDTDAAFSD
jgi:CRP/FNR family cyclic AMP-dependent transcriptional regulator